MQVRIKLMGMLKGKTPESGLLEMDDGATIADVLDRLQIRWDSALVFTVNGRLVREGEHRLAAGDEFTVLPPVGGG